MATTQNISSNYAGQDAGVYVSAAFKASSTIDKGALTVLPNIASKTNLHKVTLSNGTTDFACGFTPAGSVSMADVILDPKKLMVNLELCKEDFRQSWEAEQMGFSAHNDGGIPADFQSYFISEIVGQQGAKIDSDIWSGDAGVDGEFDGFLTQWAADGNVAKVATPVAIDASNVIEKLEATIDLVPDAVIEKPDFQILVSRNVARAYQRALSALGYMNVFNATEKPLDFEGYDLVVIDGLPSSTIVMAQKGNLYFGSGLMSDLNEVRVLDMADKDLSDNVRFKMVYTSGVQYVISEEIALYKPSA